MHRAYTSMITNLNPEDPGSTASETSVSNHLTARRNNPGSHGFCFSVVKTSDYEPSMNYSLEVRMFHLRTYLVDSNDNSHCRVYCGGISSSSISIELYTKIKVELVISNRSSSYDRNLVNGIE
jgi:hypothetical protein